MRTFDLGAVLMVAAHSRGKSSPTARLDDLSQLVNFMTSHPQVPYDPVVLQKCGESICAQHRWIAELDIPDFGTNKEGRGDEAQVEAWLAELSQTHGTMVEIAPLPEPLERTVTDAISALRANFNKVVVVDPNRPQSLGEAMNIIANDTPDA